MVTLSSKVKFRYISAMHKPIIAANWKMNKTMGETEEFIHSFLPLDKVNKNIHVAKNSHPSGELDIHDLDVDIVNILTVLHMCGFLVEGEVGIKVTPKGKSINSTIRFKPHEGLLSKFLNVLSFKVDMNLKDIFK